MPMQTPTCTGIRVRSTADAHLIFYAVAMKVLHKIERRLDTEERRAIAPGCVYVWEERGGPNTEPMGALGIERWTDSIGWGPSRVRDEFLYYQEKDPKPISIDLSCDSDTPSPLGHGPSHIFLRPSLIKQTYSAFVETTNGRRKWHLIAYLTQGSENYLRSVDDIPQLAHLRVPEGIFKSARNVRPRPIERSHRPYLYGAANNTRWHPYPTPYTTPTSVICHVPNGQLMSPRRVMEILAPLEYLENVPPPPRHPEDEKALMSFVVTLTS